MKVEPLATLVELGSTTAESDGGKMIPNELDVAVLGEPATLIVAEMIFPEAFVFATIVVQLTLVVPDAKDFVELSLMENVVLS